MTLTCRSEEDIQNSEVRRLMYFLTGSLLRFLNSCYGGKRMSIKDDRCNDLVRLFFDVIVVSEKRLRTFTAKSFSPGILGSILCAIRTIPNAPTFRVKTTHDGT